MKVIIQRPIDPLFAAGGRPFHEAVFEAELRALEGGSGWHVLQSLKATGEAPKPGMPYLHRGFFDAHLHMIWSGLFDVDVDLRAVDDFESAMRLIERRLQEGAAFVKGYGWDESRWGMTLGSLARLCETRLPEGKPIILYRACGHSALVNRTLRLAARRESGSALITDKDLPAFNETLPPPDQRQCEEAFLRAQQRVISAGITAVGDMSLDETSVAAIRSLSEQGKLLIDVQGVIEAGKSPSVENGGPFECKNAGAVGPCDRPALFSVRHWKKYLDGSLGSRTAWLSQPYDDLESFGLQLETETKHLLEQCREAVNEGFWMSFHVIGDAALDQALDVGEHLGRWMQHRPTDSRFRSSSFMRHRLEHVQVARTEQIERLERQGQWWLGLQPHHRLADKAFVESRLGEERLFHQAYRLGTFLRRNIPVGLSSDAPVDTWDPPEVIRVAMTHPNSQERVGFGEALWWYTTGSRLAMGLHPGSLTAGSTVFLTLPEAE